MTTSKKNLGKALSTIKRKYQDSIKKGGEKEKLSEIRSKKLIDVLHQFIKTELVSHSVNPWRIFPPQNKSKPELSMVGFLKSKKQDITILGGRPKNEIISRGALLNEQDKIGKKILEKSILINVRSQLSSISKNFDTLFERTFAESLNLHLRCPKLILGEVYMIPLRAYDQKSAKQKKIEFEYVDIKKYIRAFNAINGRNSICKDHYKYERVCLLIVDFEKNPPKVINSTNKLVKMKIIKSKDEKNYSLKGLTIDNFVSDLLKIYKKRHGTLKSLKFFGIDDTVIFQNDFGSFSEIKLLDY